MTVKEIYDGLTTFSEKDRVRYVGGLCKVLSPLSKGTLMDFQNSWDGNKLAEEFFQAQAETIKTCIKLEIGPLGETVRQVKGLDPLTWETEILA